MPVYVAGAGWGYGDKMTHTDTQGDMFTLHITVHVYEINLSGYTVICIAKGQHVNQTASQEPGCIATFFVALSLFEPC